MQRADVGALVLDASEGVTNQDNRIAREVTQAGRGLVVVVNKWDLIQDATAAPADADAAQLRRAERMRRTDFERILRYDIPFLEFAPLVFTSAIRGEGLEELVGTLAVVAQAFNRRVETARVNRVIQDAIARHHPPSPKGRALKIYYATQVGRRPPTS